MSKRFYSVEACRIEDLAALTNRKLDALNVALATGIHRNIPIYDCIEIRSLIGEPAQRSEVLAEWGWVLMQGPGVLVLRGAYGDTSVIDEAKAVYNDIIAQEKVRTGGKGDHFAKAGANYRIWNSLQKLCEEAPAVFARYFGNPIIDAICEAWLGPDYQMTAQVNLVRPGGKAQDPHRDYHFGFQSEETAARYPAHVHELSPVLTLQGAVAHRDMPLESGSTKLLPYSQLYAEGYMAYRREDFRAHFEGNYVQAALKKGDAVFFSPALFHAAGDNVSAGIHRMANLLQVSSVMGRAMESVDRSRMSKILYLVLQKLEDKDRMTEAEVYAAIDACAEGYSFPTNLDTDPPIGGFAPETQAALFFSGLREGWTPETFNEALDAQDAHRRA